MCLVRGKECRACCAAEAHTHRSTCIWGLGTRDDGVFPLSPNTGPGGGEQFDWIAWGFGMSHGCCAARTACTLFGLGFCRARLPVPNPAGKQAWAFPLGFCAFAGSQSRWAVTFLNRGDEGRSAKKGQERSGENAGLERGRGAQSGPGTERLSIIQLPSASQPEVPLRTGEKSNWLFLFRNCWGVNGWLVVGAEMASWGWGGG